MINAQKMNKEELDCSLYAVTTDVPEMARDHVQLASQAILGGATVIQYREKEKPFREMLKTAIKIKQLTDRSGIPLIINDRLDVTQAVAASGVHLGQDDTPLKVAREILGKAAIIGVTVNNLKQALEAQEESANYLGVSPIFETPSKSDAGAPIGCKTLRRIRDEVRIPLVAIGGITRDNVGQVIEAGADGVAVISAVAKAPDPRKATANLLDRIKNAKNKKRVRN